MSADDLDLVQPRLTGGCRDPNGPGGQGKPQAARALDELFPSHAGDPHHCRVEAFLLARFYPNRHSLNRPGRVPASLTPARRTAHIALGRSDPGSLESAVIDPCSAQGKTMRHRPVP